MESDTKSAETETPTEGDEHGRSELMLCMCRMRQKGMHHINYQKAIEIIATSSLDELSVTDKDGNNALHYAAKLDYEDGNLAGKLLKKGLSASTHNDLGETPLMLAIANDTSDKKLTNKTELFIRYGWQNLEEVDLEARTSLTYAANRGRTLAAIQLIKMGANLKVVDAHGNNLLMHAVHSTNLGTVELLLNMEVPVNHKNEIGHTVLNIAQAEYNKAHLEPVKRRLESIWKLLIANGAVPPKREAVRVRRAPVEAAAAPAPATRVIVAAAAPARSATPARDENPETGFQRTIRRSIGFVESLRATVNRIGGIPIAAPTSQQTGRVYKAEEVGSGSEDESTDVTPLLSGSGELRRRHKRDASSEHRR